MALVTVDNPTVNTTDPYSDSTSHPFPFPSTSEDLTNEHLDSVELPKKYLRRIRSFITIEPMLLLQMIAMSCTAINVQSYYIETICRKTYLNESWIDCSNLTAYKEEGKEEEITFGSFRIQNSYGLVSHEFIALQFNRESFPSQPLRHFPYVDIISLAFSLCWHDLPCI